jgi:hypothetical protein
MSYPLEQGHISVRCHIKPRGLGVVESSVSVQGSYLAGSRDLHIGGGSGELPPCSSAQVGG